MRTMESVERKYCDHLFEMTAKLQQVQGIVNSLVISHLDVDEHATNALWGALSILDDSIEMAQQGSRGELESKEN